MVALDDQDRSDFERLQQRMGLAGAAARAARMTGRVPAHLMPFDIVHLDGRLLTGLPYAERQVLLECLGLAGSARSTPAAITGHGTEAWEMAEDAGLEGLIAKRLTSRYAPGRGRLTGLAGAVLVGERRDGSLHCAGSVGTGWSHTERTRLAELLQAAAVDARPFAQVPVVAGARWVLPRLVGEVRYTSRTRAGGLRHPLLAPAAPRRDSRSGLRVRRAGVRGGRKQQDALRSLLGGRLATRQMSGWYSAARRAQLNMSR
ncbi:ATP dependent DNA ligase [Streptomyces griseus]